MRCVIFAILVYHGFAALFYSPPSVRRLADERRSGVLRWLNNNARLMQAYLQQEATPDALIESFLRTNLQYAAERIPQLVAAGIENRLEKADSQRPLSRLFRHEESNRPTKDDIWQQYQIYRQQAEAAQQMNSQQESSTAAGILTESMAE